MLSVWSKVGARAVLRLPAQASLHAGQATDLAAPDARQSQVLLTTRQINAQLAAAQ